ncbi:hypothetical protein LIL_11283 [Leptospira interrogans serovar Linhai str. 56609]|nr:conserved hypothetical protein [Leptospira interrogans serovar Copenhageni str. Fiocruz L1-130]AJR13885.1 hypothetical protein LIL_11283 [Leptospira interrogans serovar Linhai str. 56609]KWV22060.1 hypothetical protein LA733_3566 [Leptospira interrogans]KWV22614.1 hypothetical protein LA702_3544 [Leptospira interrogans]
MYKNLRWALRFMAFYCRSFSKRTIYRKLNLEKYSNFEVVYMKVFRNLFSAGILAVVLMSFLFIGTCKKKEDDDNQTNAILLWLATRPYVEQSKTGFFIIVPKGIAE